MYAHAHHEEEEREYKVADGQTIPLGVIEHLEMEWASTVVNYNHHEDGKSSEYIER